jgi:hypothetical protein
MTRLGWILALVAVVPACGGLTTSPPSENSERNEVAGSGGTSSTGERTAYPYCRWDDGNGYEQYCEPFAAGWGYYNWHVADDGSAAFCQNGDCNACNCFVPCTGNVAGECPSVAGSNAVAECLGPPSTMGGCWLTCDSGEVCPTGMACLLMPEYARQVCAWKS